MYRCGSQALLAASFQRPTRRRHCHVCQAAAVPMRRRFMFRKHCARTPRPIAHLPVAPAYALVPRCEWTAHSLSKLNLAHRPRCSSAALAPARQTAPAAPLPPGRRPMPAAPLPLHPSPRPGGCLGASLCTKRNNSVTTPVYVRAPTHCKFSLLFIKRAQAIHMRPSLRTAPIPARCRPESRPP